MKGIIYVIGASLIMLSSCSSPSSDADKVCECFSSLNSDSDENDDATTKAKKFGNKLVNKCVKIQADFTSKYSGDDLKEFNLGIADCISD